MFTPLKHKFNKINSEITEMNRKQSYGQHNWYPQLVQKLEKWKAGVELEIATRNGMYQETVAKLKVCVGLAN